MSFDSSPFSLPELDALLSIGVLADMDFEFDVITVLVEVASGIATRGEFAFLQITNLKV